MIVALGLLPGALYVWSLEAIVGGWWLGLVDRIYRFVSWSVIVHLALAPLTYALSRIYFIDRNWESGWPLLLLWAAAWIYLILPYISGRMVGRAWQKEKRWARHLVGDPAPSSWDHVWNIADGAWVRARLKDGRWVGGLYAKPPSGPTSYAAGYPNKPDLFIAQTVVIDPMSGEWSFDDDGLPKMIGSGLLLRWEDVDLLDIQIVSNGEANG